MAVVGVFGVGGISTGRCGIWDRSMMFAGEGGVGRLWL